MLIKEFEKKIQEEISPDLYIVKSPHYKDITSVYLKDSVKDFAISVVLPRENILTEEEIPQAELPYKDANDHNFRSIERAMKDIKAKYKKYSTPEARSIMAEVVDDKPQVVDVKAE